MTIRPAVVLTGPIPPSTPRRSQRLDALRAGGQVFMPGLRKPGSYRDVLSAEGFIVHTRKHSIDGVEGIIVWAEQP